MKRDFSVNVKANTIYRKKLFSKVAKIVFLALIIIISIVYLFLYIIYKEGNFTISLDRNFSNMKNIYLSEDGSLKDKSRELTADSMNYMDNISINWINQDVDTEATGAHNGENYIAYTFYVVNAGEESVNYWYQLDIDDTIKNVDEAIRIMVFENGKKTVYAKKNKITGDAEEGTEKFFSNTIAILKERKKIKPNQKDRYTIVVWLEGDDPDCTNEILGGEIKMHMGITEEHISGKKKK